MPNPTCPETCDFNLPVVSFDDCNPLIAYSEIRRVFIAKKGAAPFANWLNAAEWLTRLSQTSVVGDDYIRPLTVIGDKPAAADVVKDISNGRKKVIGKDHTLNITIDDVTQSNYEFMRALECGGQFRFWYETSGGFIYGGNEGFVANISLNDILNRGVDEIETIAGPITWRTRFSPERGLSPIFDAGGGSSAPTTYDTEIVTASSATPAAEGGITIVAGATDAEQSFEFNTIADPEGLPSDMTITVGGVEELVVTFPADYIGQYFRYTDKAGVEHVDTFVNGDKEF